MEDITRGLARFPGVRGQAGSPRGSGRGHGDRRFCPPPNGRRGTHPGYQVSISEASAFDRRF